MYLIRIYEMRVYPSEPKSHIAMAWNVVLPNGNYDYDNIIAVFQSHRDQLGIDISDSDIAEIVNVEGIEAMNAYMRLGTVEFMALNYWYLEE